LEEKEVTDDNIVLVCKKGVSIPFLAEIAQKVNPEWTTADVCTNFVKPETKEKKLAYYELYPDETDEKGNKVIGKANYFCSHAWKYKFVNVVNALEIFCESKNLVPEETYIWFDLFINNQHDAPNLSYKWWCENFKEAIKNFGKVVLVIEPWTDPTPIKRAWCLWEIFCTIDTDSEFHVAMCEEQHKDFKLRLVSDFENIRTSLSKIDARRAEAWVKSDRDKIFAAIENAVGFARLNSRVIGKMREWLLNAGQTHLSQTIEEYGDEDLRTLQTYNCLGKLYRDMNQYSTAEHLFSKALEGLVGTIGEESRHTQEVMNNYAFSLQKQGKYGEAITMHQRVLESRTKSFGKLHKDTTQSMSNLATAFRMIGKLQRAKVMFKEAVESRNNIAKMGPEHPATLYTVSQYAVTLSQMQEFDEAEEQHQRAIHGLDKFFGKLVPDGRKHPLTLLAIHNMGLHLMLMEHHTEAMRLLLEAYRGRVEKLGENAKPTMDTKGLLDQVINALREKGIDVPVPDVTPKNVDSYLKERKLRRKLWQSASSYLAFTAKVQEHCNNNSEREYALSSNGGALIEQNTDDSVF